VHQVEEAKSTIITLKRGLEAARIERQHKEEYALLGDKILQFASRDSTIRCVLRGIEPMRCTGTLS